MKWIVKIGVWVMIGCVAYLNLQPWIEVGHWMAASGLEFPFQESLLGVWGVRQFVMFVVLNIASLLAVVFWLTCQTLQIMALMADSPQVLSGFAFIFKGVPLSQWVVQNSAIIGRLGWGAYALEALVCFLVYPPYAGGMEDFIADAWMWDAYLWDWPNIALIAATILLFEAAVWLACFLAGVVLPATARKVHQP